MIEDQLLVDALRRDHPPSFGLGQPHDPDAGRKGFKGGAEVRSSEGWRQVLDEAGEGSRAQGLVDVERPGGAVGRFAGGWPPRGHTLGEDGALRGRDRRVAVAAP